MRVVFADLIPLAATATLLVSPLQGQETDTRWSVTAAATTATTVVVTWTPAPNAVAYDVQRTVQRGAWEKVNPGPLGVLTYTDAAAPSGSTIQYRVVALFVGADSQPSSSVTVMTPTAPAPTPQPSLTLVTQPLPRPPPTDVTAKSSPGSIALRWTCAANATGYDVYAAPKGGVLAKITASPVALCAPDSQGIPLDPRYPMITVDKAGFTHIGLAALVEFTYVVRALYSNGLGDSIPITAQTPPWPAPTGLTAAVVLRSVTLNWTPVLGSAGYLVKRKLQTEAAFQDIITSPISVTTFKDTAVPNGEYLYSVHAVNGVPAIVNARTPLGPDLVVDPCTFEPSNPSETDRIAISAKWHNAGNAEALIPHLASEWQAQLTGGIGGGRASGTAYTIPVGGTKSGGLYVAEPFSRPPGTYSGTLTIDAGNHVAETDETNNSVPCSVTIAPATSFPDLVISQITPWGPAKQGTTIYIHVVVKNQGTGIAFFRWQPETRMVDVGGLGYGGTTSSGPVTIDPGQSKTIAILAIGAASQAGTTIWTVKVDPNNVVRESDENNNQATQSVTVEPP